MTIVDIAWHPYTLPFRSSFITAHGTFSARDGAIIEVVTTDGISGIGEIAPLPAFGGEKLNDALVSLPAIAARLHGKTLVDALDHLYAQQEASSGDHKGAPLQCGRPNSPPASTIYGLEIALLDALGKAEGCTLSELLAPANFTPRPGVHVNAVISASTITTAVQQAREAIVAGFGCVKLKMGTGLRDEIERVAAVREVIGPDVHLRLDANEAWSFEQACTILAECAPYAIQYIEQPLKVNDLAGMCRLRQKVPIPIAADEAIYDLQSARRTISQQAADLLIIKPQLAGGLRASQRIVHEAANNGVQCVLTSTLEAGIGVLAALHLAAATLAITLECGLATLDLLVDDLLLDSLPVRDGFLTLPAGPGLGIELDRAALTKYSSTLRENA